ncbi:MAG: hypothetical protein GY866_26670 [Proteobacteria bacterium]|nr:hypothetical protein [Pseudomonadota bacterium]
MDDFSGKRPRPDAGRGGTDRNGASAVRARSARRRAGGACCSQRKQAEGPEFFFEIAGM